MYCCFSPNYSILKMFWEKIIFLIFWHNSNFACHVGQKLKIVGWKKNPTAKTEQSPETVQGHQHVNQHGSHGSLRCRKCHLHKCFV